jgi:hypothetical protein
MIIEIKLTMKTTYKHYILTRFNAGLYSNPISVPPRLKNLDDWLKHRLILFEKFTLPSMMNQSCQNFSWMLLVDKLTPEKFIYRIENFGYSNIRICYTSTDIYSPTISNTQMWGIDTYEHSNLNIITTRIDNDDAFHVDFVKEIQRKYAKLVNESKPFIISFPLGYVIDLKVNQIISYGYRRNNCLSLVASCNKKNFMSVFCCSPPGLFSKYKTFFVHKSEPYWLIIIHSQNLGTQKLLQRFTKPRQKISNSILSTFGISKSGKIYGSAF